MSEINWNDLSEEDKDALEKEGFELYQKYQEVFGKEPALGFFYLGDPGVVARLKQSIETGEPIPDLPEGVIF